MPGKWTFSLKINPLTLKIQAKLNIPEVPPIKFKKYQSRGFLSYDWTYKQTNISTEITTSINKVFISVWMSICLFVSREYLQNSTQIYKNVDLANYNITLDSKFKKSGLKFYF